MAFLALLLCLSVWLTDGFLDGMRCKLGLRRAASTSSLSYGHFAGEKASDADREYSFVQDDMRKVAMKLHTRDQAPREGKQEAQTPFTRWEPTSSDYMQFLVDSLEVYQALENIVGEIIEFQALAFFSTFFLARANIVFFSLPSRSRQSLS